MKSSHPLGNSCLTCGFAGEMSHKIVSDKEMSISFLGKQVSALSSEVAAYLTRSPFPNPSFEADGGDVPEDPEYDALRTSLNDVALDLLRLVNGPKTTLRDLFFSHYDLAALQVALDRRFFHHVPLVPASASGDDVAGASTTIAEIAAKAGMDEGRTGALLKLLATRRIFEPVDHGDGVERFKHTAISASMARDSEYHALGDMQLDDIFKASSELSSLVTQSPHASSPTESAFHQRFGVPVYQYYDEHPEKGKRFAQAMSSWSKGGFHVLSII